MKTYTERTMCAALARNTFERDLVAVNNCTHTGEEIDLLVVDVHSLRLIDVEVKISRGDLKADILKDRWVRQGWREPAVAPRSEKDAAAWAGVSIPSGQRDWPFGIWKHYYAVSADVWNPELLQYCRPKSGVLVVTATGVTATKWHVTCVRRSTPNKSAVAITLTELAQIARLASLRMWDAYAREFDGQVKAERAAA